MTLTDREKEQIKALIDAGEPLPPRYRSALFAEPHAIELIWPGKTAEVTNVVLPFQSIEQIDEPRSGTQAGTTDLFAFDQTSGRQTGGWTNKLIWGDNKLVLASLKNGPLRREIEAAGGLKLVYIDPPFEIGADFSHSVDVGEGESVVKEPTIIEDIAYRDTWGRGKDSYASMIYERLLLISGLMAPDASIFVHVGPTVNHLVRAILEEIFDDNRFVNEIIWRRAFAHNDPSRCGSIHDAIYYFSKGEKRTWNKTLQKPSPEYVEQFFDQYDEARKERYARLPLDAPRHGDGGNLVYEWKGAWPAKNRTWANVKEKMEEYDRLGRIHYPKSGMPRLKRYESEYEGTLVQDIWTDINKIHNQSSELLDYATQKPEALLNRILGMASNEGDLVADFFCGSGTTLAVAEKLGRKWIGADLGRFAIHTSRKRLIGVQRELKQAGKPYRSFEILNLGKYERQFFAGIDPTLPDEQRRAISLQKEEHYLTLILNAYKAERNFQMPPFHGRKGGTLVLVGPIDAPVTQGQVMGYEMLLPPLVFKVRRGVKTWRDSGYEGASATTRALLNHWFRTEHLVPMADGTVGPFQWYFAQREAVESAIWLYEVERSRDPYALLKHDSSGRVSKGMFAEDWPRYVMKLATGAGKTKVMSLLIAWCYFHKRYEPDSELSTNFLVIAPNIIVLDRLLLDFDGLKIFYQDPILPPNGYEGQNWQDDFQLMLHVQDQIGHVSDTGNIFLSNIHRIYEGDNPPAFEDTDSTDYFLGSRPKGKTTDRQIDLGVIVRDVPDLVILNDEAHHIHDPRMAWFKSIEDIALRLRQKGSQLAVQFDLTATPKSSSGAIFVQTISDYPLVEAIRQGVVKTPVLPDQASRAKLQERKSAKFTEQYEDYLHLGYLEWKKVYEELLPTGKKSVLFIMTDDTRNCDEVAAYLESRYADFKGGVLVIHTKNNGEISEAATGKSKDELDKLRKLSREIDHADNPYKVIVSVMVLREGWDVQNVVTIVGLRPFTATSKILPEQTLGRGLRRMFRDKPVQEKVSVIGTDAFMDFVESIKVEGVELEYQPMGDKGGAPTRPSMTDRAPSTRSSSVRKIGKPIGRARSASSQRHSASMDTIDAPTRPLITASMLYDLENCPHRVSMDLYGDPAERDEVNAFVQLLWEKGSVFEHEVIGGLKIPFLDLSAYAGDEKERLTLEAMQRGEPLIYGGRIQEAGLLGDPDLLRKETGGYIAGDIKSGSGEEGADDDAKPKLHYAVQLGLYTDILERKGLSAGRRAFVWDIHGKEVLYDFAALYGKRDPTTLWLDYQYCLHQATVIINGVYKTRPAYSSACKLCYWNSACVKRLKATDDLSLIPELGRAKRDAMLSIFETVKEFSEAKYEGLIDGKGTVFEGIGPATLAKFHMRAKLLSTKDATPVLRAPVQLPGCDRELFFDIEVDPMRDICYLRGFVEREGRDNATEKFVAFFADECTPASERAAFASAWAYIRGHRPCAIYYYSKYERTIYRKLQQKYPDVCSAEEIEELFDPAHAIDLYYDVVKKATEWPTWDYSIKTLAKYLGFAWRDTHPSGAASIEWFDRWINTGDRAIRQRILDYNEDDCRATRVLLDGIRDLPTQTQGGLA